MKNLDCDCPEGLEGDCEACRLDSLEKGIEAAELEAEHDEELSDNAPYDLQWSGLCKVSLRN